jgi:hypothetical protein
MPFDQIQKRLDFKNSITESEIVFVSFEGYGKLHLPVLNEPKMNSLTLLKGASENRRYETDKRLTIVNCMPKELFCCSGVSNDTQVEIKESWNDLYSKMQRRNSRIGVLKD